jgi:hypothetical protein
VDVKEANVLKLTLHGCIRGSQADSSASQITGGRLKGFKKQPAASRTVKERFRRHPLGPVSPAKTVLELLLQRQQHSKACAGGVRASTGSMPKECNGPSNADTEASAFALDRRKSIDGKRVDPGIVHMVSQGPGMSQEASCQRVRALNISTR